MKYTILPAAIFFHFLTNIAYSEQTKNCLQPSEIVKDILNQQTPKNTAFVAMTNAHHKTISPLLSQELNELLSEWIKGVNSIKKFPEGFDPLLRRKWNPDKIRLGSLKKTNPDTAIIRVKEKLNPGKIFSGYAGVSIFMLKKENGKWVVNDIKFIRKIYSSDDIEAFLLTRELMADITLFNRIKVHRES